VELSGSLIPVKPALEGFTRHKRGMDGGWTGNSFLLGSSSLANHGG
jgi:hypothetical protein